MAQSVCLVGSLVWTPFYMLITGYGASHRPLPRHIYLMTIIYLNFFFFSSLLLNLPPSLWNKGWSYTTSNIPITRRTFEIFLWSINWNSTGQYLQLRPIALDMVHQFPMQKRPLQNIYKLRLHSKKVADQPSCDSQRTAPSLRLLSLLSILWFQLLLKFFKGRVIDFASISFDLQPKRIH